MLSLSEAAIYSTSVEAILYGFSVLMYIFTMWILLQNRKRRRLNHGMLYAATALLVLSTAEMAVNILRLRQGYLSLGPFLPGGPEQFFQDVSQTTFVIKSCLYNAQTLILDGVVIWRTYVVWQRFYVIIVPVLGWLGLFAAIIGTNVTLATASTHSRDIFFVETGRWITANYSATLATNLSATGLLAFRIWQVKRQSSKYLNHNRLTPILRVVIESGAIYTFTITAALITFVTKSNGVYVLLDMLSPIIAIVFNMITVRVGLAQEQRLSGGSVQGTTNPSSDRRPSIPIQRSHDPYGASLAVEITQFIETDESPHDEIDLKTKPGTLNGGPVTGSLDSH